MTHLSLSYLCLFRYSHFVFLEIRHTSSVVKSIHLQIKFLFILFCTIINVILILFRYALLHLCFADHIFFLLQIECAICAIVSYFSGPTFSNDIQHLHLQEKLCLRMFYKANLSTKWVLTFIRLDFTKRIHRDKIIFKIVITHFDFCFFCSLSLLFARLT